MKQEWEGVVTDVGDSSFWAALEDITDQSSPTEIAEFPRGTIPDGRLEKGLVFYWTIEDGVSQIHVPPRVVLTPEDVHEIRRKATKLFRAMKAS